MEILEYYDEERIRKESYILTSKRYTIMAIISTISIILSAFILREDFIKENIMREDIQIFMREDIQIQTIVLIIIESLMFLLSYIGLTYSVHKINESHDYKTRKELELLKKKYIENRKQILDKHNYRYSIYERSFSINARCKVIVREIMCNEFTVNSQGQAFITYSESDFILKETEPLKIEYHHITDNKDGHILTVKELKNFIAEE